MRLGLLGGSFNPVHNGHLGLARQAAGALPLDGVLFIPTGDPPHKCEAELAPAHHRAEMIRLAIEHDPPFALSDIELTRPGKSYSIDTVQALQRKYGSASQLYFLIGLDAFLDLPTWKAPEALLNTCRFVVIARPGHQFRSLSTFSLIPNLAACDLDSLDSGASHRLDVPSPTGPGLICLRLTPSPISASDIRLRIRRGATLANLLPPSVESYIIRHRLYQEDPDRTNI
jgi:nicotinate-nucleotide adenylyltransferase